MDKKILKAETRTITGRKVKNIRKAGKIPGNVYGKDVKSLSVQVSQKEFESVYKEVGETGLIELKIGDEAKPVLVHGIQVNPKTSELVHIDFLQVNLKVKISAQVPIELVGESPAEKQALGIVVQQLNEVEVEALPADLPDKFELSIENLSEVDQALYVSDIKTSDNVEILTDKESLIAKVEPPQKEEAPVVSTEEPTTTDAASPEQGAVETENKEESKE